MRSIRTWLEPSSSTMTSLTTNASAPWPCSVPGSADRGLGPGDRCGGRGDRGRRWRAGGCGGTGQPEGGCGRHCGGSGDQGGFIHPRAPFRCPGGLTPQERGAGTLPPGHLGWPEVEKSCLSRLGRYGSPHGEERQRHASDEGNRAGGRGCPAPIGWATRQAVLRGPGSDQAGHRELLHRGRLPHSAGVRDRPIALERWPGGWREGMTLSADATGRQRATASTRSGSPKGAPDWLETCRVNCPRTAARSTRSARASSPSSPGPQAGHADLPPLARTQGPSSTQPDELRIDLDPQPGTTFTSPAGGRRRPRAAGGAGPAGVPEDPAATAACTSTCGSEPEWSFDQVRHAAIGLGRELERRDDGVTTAWWKEERGEASIFLDFNQNLRDRTVAGAWSLRPRPGAPVSTPMTWERLAEVDDPRAFNLHTVPEYLADGDPWADMDDEGVPAGAVAAAVGRASRRRAELPAGLPEDAGGAATGPAEQEGRRALGRAGQPNP